MKGGERFRFASEWRESLTFSGIVPALANIVQPHDILYTASRDMFYTPARA